MASTDARPNLHDQQNHPSPAATSTSMEMPPTDMDPPTNHPTMLPTEPPGAMDPTIDDLIYINPHLEGARPTTYTRMLEEFTEQNPSPEDRWCYELYTILKMESDNIRSGTNCISDLPELAIPTITYSYPTFMGEMKRVASCRTGYDKEETGGWTGEDWDDLRGVQLHIVPDNSAEEAADDSKYYSTPPAAVTVNQGEELCQSAQSNTCTSPRPTTPASSPSVVEIASESAPAVEAEPTITSQVSGPPQHAQDATVETMECLTFTYDFSLFQDRSWLALTVEEASHALSSTPLSHPHHAANLNQALQHAESSLCLFPSCLRLIPLMSICRILSLQGNQTRADLLQSEGLAIHTEGRRVFTLMSSSRLHEERFSSAQEAEHLETAITYMTNELATQNGKERSLLLLFLSCMHNYRFIATQEAVDLDMAIEYLAEMTGINADPKHQRILARYYVTRYDIGKDLTDLEAATAAVEATLSHAKGSTVCSDVALRAEVAHQKWLHTDWKYHVRAAINWSMTVVEYLDNEEDILAVYVKLGAQLRGYARITGDRRGLAHAKDLTSKIVRRPPEGHELQGVLAEELASLESMLGSDYGKDPVAHIEAGLEAMDPEEDPELYLDRLMVHSEALMKRFDRQGNPADITAALEKLEIVVAATEHIGWRHVVNLDALSCYLLRRFNALGDLTDLDSAVMYGEMCLTAAAAAPESDGIHRNVIPALQFHLCGTYFERTKYNTELTDLDKALKLATMASEGIEEGHPLYISRLTHIGGLYVQRFARSSVKKDIDTGIAIGQQALQAALRIDGCDTNQLAMVNGNISELYRSRYLVFKSDEDMTDGIRHGEEALRLTPRDYPGYAGRLILVGNWLHERYLQSTGKVEDIDRGIEYLKTAIQMSSNRYQVQMAKSFLFEMQTHRRGSDLTNIAPLNAEIEAGAEAVAALPPGQSLGAAAMKTWLAVQYRVRYERIGDPADIEKAVEYSYAALSDFPDAEGRRGAILSELSAHLMSRYKRLGAMDDLDMSISIARESVKCTPIESHRRHDRLIELCQHLIDRFRRSPVSSSSYDDLLAAITLGQLCVDATAGREGPVHFQLILADALHLRHLAAPVLIQDLHRAIILTLNALMDPRGTGHIPTKDISYRLGHLYHSRFRCTQQVDDIDLAIEYLEHTLRRLHEDEPARGKTLDLLGRCYLMRYQAMQNTGPDGQRSFHAFRDAWNTLSAPPLLRINGAQRVGDVYARSGRWADAVVMYEGCVNLMPQISRPFLSRLDQQRLLAALAGITSRAATGALIAGKGATHALKLLELGRGIIAGFIIDCRSDMTDLRSDHPELCREFAALRKEMEDGLSTPVRATGWEILGPESVMAWRKKVMTRMEEVLRTIRALPGYEEFLRPPSGKSLMALAVSGPLVVVNADFFGCDAIIITSTAIKSITLEKCDWGTARELLGGMKDLVTGGITTYADRTKKMQALLIWLWDVIVSPVLTVLGITAPPPPPPPLGELPHIWWMGTGPLGLAPFHAAGHHTNGSTENTISRVISSYTPNLKALQYSRQKPAETIRDLLLVAMPTTDDENELEGVEEELAEIVGIVQPDVTTNIMVQPDVPEVLSSLGNYQAVHFACHGVTEADDPSSGGLLLQGGRLTVADVAAKSGCAMMAYLSACSTAETGDSNLVDEGITLAGAFQMAGFRHVVATMWEGRDEVCTVVAESFYESVVKKGCGVAKALHDAVVKARGEGRRTGKVLDWAPFIHNGA